MYIEKLTFIPRCDLVDSKDGFLTMGQAFGSPGFDIAKADEEDGGVSELCREGVVRVQDQTMDRRLVDVSFSQEAEPPVSAYPTRQSQDLISTLTCSSASCSLPMCSASSHFGPASSAGRLKQRLAERFSR